ncbi:MAG: hypothetical protein ACOC43_15305 [Desulfohalobiaceae bacterium]
MAAQWVLNKVGNQDGSCKLLLGLQDRNSGQVFYLEQEFLHMQQLQGFVQDLSQGLQEILSQAEALWQESETKEQDPVSNNPQDIWRQMQDMGEEQMMEFFNALAPELRSQVAEHILSTANMFKGAGALFAAKYDAGHGRMD